MRTFLILTIFCTCLFFSAFSQQNKSIPKGSYIVNLGVTPQTIANGLKPYGLVYDLVTNNNVPVMWVIRSNKGKDQNDFHHNGVFYKGSAFVIDSFFLSTAVKAKIANFITAGGAGNYTNYDTVLPVYNTITYWPKAVMDAANEGLPIAYYNNAGIPTGSYTVGKPTNITNCEDMYVMPHADPTAAPTDYAPLYNFTRVNRGYVWANCHSVSELEGSRNGTEQLNFLSVSGLKCHNTNECGFNTQTHLKIPTNPITLDASLSGDPLMQFVGDPLPAMYDNGSEYWYVPVDDNFVRVQSANGSTAANPATSFLVTLPAAPAAGNTLIAVIATRGSSTDRVTSISQTNVTWQRASQAANINGSTTEIWYAMNVSGTAATGITINQANLRSAAVVMEYRGLLTASTLDITSNGSTGNSTSASTGTTTAATSQDNTLLIGGIGLVSSGITLGSITNSFTVVDNQRSTHGTAGNNARIYALERFVTSTGNYSSGGTVSSSSQWSGTIAAFKAIKGSWNSDTKLYVTTSDGSGKKKGTQIIGGYAYGNSSYGRVAYQGGHDLTNKGTVAEQVAAQRVFLNFLLLSAIEKKPNLSVTNPSLSSAIAGSTTFTLNSNVSGGVAPYTYAWSSPCTSASFSTPSASSTNLTIPNPSICRVVLRVTDACQRKNFSVVTANTVLGSILSEGVLSLAAKQTDKHIQLRWDQPENKFYDQFFVERSYDGIYFLPISNTVANSESYTSIDQPDFTKKMVYYRLRTNENNLPTYSNTVIVKLTQHGTPAYIFPNPVKDFVQLMNLPVNQTIQIAVFGIGGQKIIDKTLSSSTGSYRLALPEITQRGMYYLQIKSQDNFEVLKFVKE